MHYGTSSQHSEEQKLNNPTNKDWRKTAKETSLVPYELGWVCCWWCIVGGLVGLHVWVQVQVSQPRSPHPPLDQGSGESYSQWVWDRQSDRQMETVLVCLNRRISGVRSCLVSRLSSRGLSRTSLLPQSSRSLHTPWPSCLQSLLQCTCHLPRCHSSEPRMIPLTVERKDTMNLVKSSSLKFKSLPKTLTAVYTSTSPPHPTMH